MFCSTVIATIARTSLGRAVQSVLQQEFSTDDFEVIVVNDVAESLPAEDWQADPRVRVIRTNQRGPQVAQNTGAAMAAGRYLHFLDDDDWLLPGAIVNLWELSQRAGDVAWLYGATQLVDRATGQPLIQLRHELRGNIFTQAMAGEWIPLQSSFISANAFMAAGGMNPALGLSWDIDLCRRITLRSSVLGTDTPVACYSAGAGSSVRVFAAAGRAARENILDQPGVFARLLDSATSPYWHGRMLRLYLTSMVWNMGHRRLFAAASRAGFAALSACVAAAATARRDFWNGLLLPHQGEAFRRGLRERATRSTSEGDEATARRAPS